MAGCWRSLRAACAIGVSFDVLDELAYLPLSQLNEDGLLHRLIVQVPFNIKARFPVYLQGLHP